MGIIFQASDIRLAGHIAVAGCCIVWFGGNGVGTVFSRNHPLRSWPFTVITRQTVFNKYILPTLCQNVCAPN